MVQKIESEYYDPQKGCYAFATNPSGPRNSPVDHTSTIYPAIADWDYHPPAPVAAGGSKGLQAPE